MPFKQLSTSAAAGHLNALSASGAATVAWLADLELVFRMGVSAVGIVSGVYAILWYRHRISRSKREERDNE